MPRLPDLDAATLTPAQRTVFERIATGPRGRVEGPLRVWVNSPELAETAQALGAFCRYGTSLPQRLTELAILVTGAHWQAGFEWFVHAPLAIAAGINPAAVEAIRKGGLPVFDKPDEAAVYAFAHDLVTTRKVPPAVYADAVRHLSAQGVVELVGVLGYYALISMTIVAFEVPIPDGETEPFPAT
jgi:4-carboxymuconolactone decarboxylase